MVRLIVTGDVSSQMPGLPIRIEESDWLELCNKWREQRCIVSDLVDTVVIIWSQGLGLCSSSLTV